MAVNHSQTDLKMWHLIIDKATGKLVSEGSRLPEYDLDDFSKRDQPLAEHLEVVTVQARPDWRTQHWNASTRQLVARDNRKTPQTGLDVLKRLTPTDIIGILRRLGVAEERLLELMEKR